MLIWVGIICLIIGLAALAKMRQRSDLEGYRCDPSITIEDEEGDLDFDDVSTNPPEILSSKDDREAETKRDPK